MRVHGAALAPAMLSLSLLALDPTSASADWMANGTRAMPLQSHYPGAAPDGHGGVFVSSTPGNVRLFHLDDQGAIADGWDSLGVGVAKEDEYLVWTPVLVADGSGGVYALVHERRCPGPCRPSEGSQLGLQHLDPAGRVVPGWPAAGLHLSSGFMKNTFNDPNTASASIVPDGCGGVLVAWSGIQPDVIVHRIAFDGRRLWGPNGITVNAVPWSHLYATVAADGGGGAFVYWVDDARPDDARVMGQHFSAVGRPMWPAGGIQVSTTRMTQALRPSCVSDGARGSIVAWAGQAGADFDVFVARVNHGGGLPWQRDLRLCGAAGDQSEVKLVPSRTGGAIVAWRDARVASEIGLYIQRVSLGGSVEWEGDGLAVATTLQVPYQANSFAMLPDRAGGAILGWGDTRPDFTVFVQRLDGSGHPRQGWAPGGTPVCADRHLPYGGPRTEELFLVGDPDRDPVLVWDGVDYSCPTYCGVTVRAMRIGPGGPVTPATVGRASVRLSPRAVTLPGRDGDGRLRVRPGPVGGVASSVSLRLVLPRPAPAVIEVFDVSGRRVWRREVALAAGEHDFPLGNAGALSPGVYMVRVRQSGQAAVSRLVVDR